MAKFEKGDIVKISSKWLDKGENPDTLYYVLEDLTDEVFKDGRVKVAVEAPYSVFKYHTYVYSYDMVYKVGHIDLKDLK